MANFFNLLICLVTILPIVNDTIYDIANTIMWIQ